MFNLKFTEKHLALVLGIPIALIAVAFFILTIYYAMDSKLEIPTFFKWSVSFYKDFVNIATTIMQIGGSAIVAIISIIKINDNWS